VSKTDAQILADAIESWPDHPWLPGAAITPELREVIARNRTTDVVEACDLDCTRQPCYHDVASGYAAKT